MKKLWVVIVVVWLLSQWASAETVSMEEVYTTSGLEQVYSQLSSQVKETLTHWGVTPEGLLSGEGLSFSGVMKTVGTLMAQTVKNPLSAMGMGVGVLLLCGLLTGMAPKGKHPMEQSMQYFAGLCMITSYVVPAGYTLSKASSALAGVGVFMLAFVPVYIGLLFMSGGIHTAGGAGALVFTACEVLSYFTQRYLVPLVGLFQALAVCESVTTGVHIGGFTPCVKKCVTWGLGIVITLFTGVLSLTGMINGAGDSLAGRTTRFFIGNMVPVIGGAISDSFGSLQGCFSLLKTGGGILAVCVVAVMVLPVLLEIGLWRLVTAVLTAFSQTMQMDSLTFLLQTVGEGMSLLFSLVICCLVVYVVCLSSLMLAGGGS